MIKNIIFFSFLLGLVSTIEGSLSEHLVPAPTPSPSARLSKSPGQQTSPQTGTLTLDTGLRLAVGTTHPHQPIPSIPETTTTAPDTTANMEKPVPKGKHPVPQINGGSFAAALLDKGLLHELQDPAATAYQASGNKTPPLAHTTESGGSVHSTPRDDFMEDSDTSDDSKDSCCKRFGKCLCCPLVTLLVTCGIIKEEQQ